MESYLKKKEKNIEVMQEKVDDVNGNIQGFYSTRAQLLEKLYALSGDTKVKKRTKSKERTQDDIKKMNRNHTNDTLKIMDPDSKDPRREKIISMVEDVMNWSKIQGETPNENLVVCLSKVEDNLLHFIDARNHLNWKDKLIKPNDRNGLLHLEKYEVKLQKDKVEEKLQNFKAAAEAKLIEEKER